MQKYIHNNIVKISLANELDIVLAYKRARQLGELTGIAKAAQTKFATAVSEICRNVIEHVGTGTIVFSLVEDMGNLYLEALTADYGRGIANLEELLKKKEVVLGSKGCGIVHARRLSDQFNIESNSAKGTKVWLLKKIPAQHPPINKAIINGWVDYFTKEVPVSPYEEIKEQNMHILDVLETLRLKNLESENQIEEITTLNNALEKSNYDVNLLLKERDETNQLLQKMNKELEDFAFTVSHDLKAPLKNIEGISSLLKKTILASENKHALLQFDILVTQIHKMDKLITGILSYAKSGRQHVEKSMVDVAVLLKEVIDSQLVPEGFHIQIQPTMPVVETEEIYLHQIFSNLIANAIKYHDKQEANISITCEEQEKYYEFCVSDDGPGILPQHQHRIFRMFYAINTSADNSSGLGLSIIKKITQEKGCKVWVESQGRGAKFFFTWPI